MYVMRALANPGPGYVSWTVFRPDYAGSYAPAPVQAGTAVIASGPLPEDIQEVDLEMLAGNASHDLNGWLTVGSIYIDPADWEFAQANFAAIMSTSDAGHSAQVRLWNVTTASQVGATLTTVSLVPDVLNQNIILAAGPNYYEIQIQTATDGFVATCGGAVIRLLNLD